MKVLNGLFALVTVVLACIASFKVFEKGEYNAIDFLILSLTAMLLTVIIASLNNGKNN